MVVIPEKDLVYNGGMFFAPRKLVSKFGSNILGAEKIYVKASSSSGISVNMYRKINVTKNDENLKIVFSSPKGERVVFVV